MRTTIDIADDVLDAARTIAADEKRSLGQVVSRLARRGLNPATGRGGNDFPEFTVPPDAPVLSLETVRRALDDG